MDLHTVARDLGSLISKRDLYDEARDLGSLIGGVLALIAGILAYRAGVRQARETRQAADRQLAADAQKDRLQAHGIAVGIYPELLNIEVDHERASKIVCDEFPKIISTLPDAMARFAELSRSLRILIPPLLNRNIDHLYLLDDAGRTLTQLVSFILQYNDMVEILARHISEGVETLKPADHAKSLSPHLRSIGVLLRDVRQKLTAIHDEAVPPEQSTPIDS